MYCICKHDSTISTIYFFFWLILVYLIEEAPLNPRIGVIIRGAFSDDNSNSTNFLYMYVQLLHTQAQNDSHNSNIETQVFKIPIIENIDDIDKATELKKTHTFELGPEMYQRIPQNDTILQICISSNLVNSFPITLAYDPTPIDKHLGVIYATIVLIGLYIAIIWEIIHRTFAAMVASTSAIAILALMNERPTMLEIVSWIDVETLLLLFGMMILVAILSETGIFDYLAVYAFKVCLFYSGHFSLFIN